MEIEKSIRYRINIKETAKHERYFDCTVDMLNASMDEVLIESDKLVAELSKRYLPQATIVTQTVKAE